VLDITDSDDTSTYQGGQDVVSGGTEAQLDDDWASEYTSGPDIQEPRRNAYISWLAEDLLSKAFAGNEGKETLARAWNALPRTFEGLCNKAGDKLPQPCLFGSNGNYPQASKVGKILTI
jgi:hypothetical protein